MNTIRLNTIGDSPVVVKKGSQVQSQEKTVEITENGTTEVVPDAGFSLSKVTINTDVESSGSANIKYLNVQKLHETGMFDTVIVMIPGLLAVKAVGSDLTTIAPLSYLSRDYYSEITSIAILDDFQGLIENDNNVNSSEAIANFINAGCFEITKEQFYNLEA